MDALKRLQSWYARECDGDWEHTSGVKIESLDNPGWSLTIDVYETDLNDRPFPIIERTATPANLDDWIYCRVQDGRFFGAGGPSNLGELLEAFLQWAEQ
jgi:hypothetical protein